MKRVFIFESAGGAQWMNIGTMKKNCIYWADLFLLAVLREIRYAVDHGLVGGNREVKGGIDDLGKRLLAGDQQGALELLADLRDSEFVDGEDVNGLGAAFSLLRQWRTHATNPMEAILNLIGSLDDGKYLFAGSNVKNLKWDKPKRVSGQSNDNEYMIAGDFIVELRLGRFNRAWAVDSVAADSQAPEDARVAADQALEQKP